MGNIVVSLPSDGDTIDVSDYNTPITTIVNEINGNLDNTNIAASAAIAGSKLASSSVTDTQLASASVTPTKLATGAASATVTTGQTTTSTSYTDLATRTDTVTVTIGANGLALVAISSAIANSTANAKNFVSVDISGANTVAASDENAIELQCYAANAEGKLGKTVLMTGLAAGSTTFKMKYKVATGGSGAGTGTFADRKIAVVPL